MEPSSRKRWFGASLEIVLFISVVVGIVLGVVLVGRPQGTRGATGGVTEYGLLQETAVPSNAVVSPSLVPGASTPQPSASVLQPETPVYVQACGQRVTDVNVVNDFASIIVRGTVQHVPPPKWSTPDGKRPRNPHARDSVGFIYRPVIIKVEQYLKGEQPQQTLLVIASGGTVGQDTLDHCGDPIFTFQEGEQVVLFLYPRDADSSPVEPATQGGPPALDIAEHYTVTDDGQAFNIARQVPVQQLLDEIQAAQRP